MPGQKGIDLLMKIKISGQTHVQAESTDVVGREGWDQDLLMTGFKPGTTTAPGNVFELESFSFGTKVKERSSPEDDAAAAKAGVAKQQEYLQKLHAHLASGKTGAPPGLKAPRSEFKNFLAGKDAQYDAEVDPVTFTRYIDRASSRLLQACFNSSSFESATLVKRRSTGGEAAGYGYLRMDFGNVLITKLSWEDDDRVKESCTFIFRSVLVQYRPQLPDGSLGDPVPGKWNMPSAELPRPN